MLSWLGYNALAALPFALVALLAERVLRRRPAAVHLLWLVVLARLVAPPFGGAAGAPATPDAAAAASLIRAGPDLGLELAGRMTRAFGPSWSTWLARGARAGLALGFVFLLARELVHLLRARAGLRRAAPASRAVLRRTHAVARRLGVRAPPVRVLAGIASPFVWSARRALLVLPEEPPATAVLAHELAHVRRRDHWTGWLEIAVLGLCWWNPLAWIARRRMQLFAELACDACVVQHFPTQRATYARALVDGLRAAPEARRAPRTLRALGWSALELELRLTRILGGADSARLPRGLASGTVLALVLSLPGVAAPDLGRFRAALPSIPSGIDSGVAQPLLGEAQRALAATPDDGAALGRRGLARMGLGLYREAALDFERELVLGHRPERAAYNLACALARAGDAEPALEALEAALALGVDPAYLRLDPDLEGLREHPGFARLASAAAGASAGDADAAAAGVP